MSRTTCTIAISTPEWTVPMMQSTSSRLIRRLTFSGRLGGIDFVVELHEFDRPAAVMPPISARCISIAQVMFSPSAV